MLLTAPLAKMAGQSVRKRNLLLFIGFGFMIGADVCFGLDYFATTQGESTDAMELCAGRLFGELVVCCDG